MSSRIRTQLVIFAVISLLGVGHVALNYVDLPRMLTLGTYGVSVELAHTGSLYGNAIVTYRGVQIGLVHDIEPTATGVTAHLRIDRHVHIPADLTASVRSVSPVGEQYLDLVPGSATGPELRDGATVPESRTTLPTSTSELLDRTHSFVSTLPGANLNTAVTELGNTFDGSGPALGDLLTSTHRFLETAHANLEPTLSLVAVLAPVLSTQTDMAPLIRTLLGNLAGFTDQLAASDGALRGILARTPETTRQVTLLTSDLRTPLPALLANVDAEAEVLNVFRPNLRQILALGPPVVVALQNFGLNHPGYVQLDLGTNVNTPPYCTSGYTTRGARDPNDLRPVPAIPGLHCTAPPESPQVVRGVRNAPCPHTAQRSATAAGCGYDFSKPPRR